MPVHIRVPDWRTLHVAYIGNQLKGWRTRVAADGHVRELRAAGLGPERAGTAATLPIEHCGCGDAA